MNLKAISKALELPQRWKLAFYILAGALAGLVLFLVYISKFFSYLSDQPETCMNCHIMGPQYATWFHSSHREVANCNDCHVPHDNFLKKYLFKAMDGSRHSFMFTFHLEPQAIKIKEMGQRAVEGNCRRCHDPLFGEIKESHENIFTDPWSSGRRCWDCHRETPHGTVRSLSSAPYAKVPTTESMIPDWLKQIMNEEGNTGGRK